MAAVRVQVGIVVSPGELRRIEGRIYEAVEKAVIRTVELGESTAKRLAPVRKISEEVGRRRVRHLTVSEIRSIPSAIRKQYTPAQLSNLSTTTRRSKQSLEAPEVTESISGALVLKNKGDTSFLNRRGRSELRQAGVNASFLSPARRAPNKSLGRMQTVVRGRESAIHVAGVGRTTLGGRLRDEIRYRQLNGGSRIVYLLESPTPYAKYVEFPTSRTAAQPYMRPAREAMRRALARNAVTELKRAKVEVY